MSTNLKKVILFNECGIKPFFTKTKSLSIEVQAFASLLINKSIKIYYQQKLGLGVTPKESIKDIFSNLWEKYVIDNNLLYKNFTTKSKIISSIFSNLAKFNFDQLFNVYSFIGSFIEISTKHRNDCIISFESDMLFLQNNGRLIYLQFEDNWTNPSRFYLNKVIYDDYMGLCIKKFLAKKLEIDLLRVNVLYNRTRFIVPNVKKIKDYNAAISQNIELYNSSFWTASPEEGKCKRCCFNKNCKFACPQVASGLDLIEISSEAIKDLYHG